MDNFDIVCEIMDKYNKEHSRDGIERNLEAWSNNKSDLIELLSKHPDWDPDAMGIVFNIEEERQIDRWQISRCTNRLLRLYCEQFKSHTYDDYLKFSDAVESVTSERSKYITKQDRIDYIKRVSGVKCAVGQKASRILGAICRNFGFSSEIPGYDACFASISDVLSPSTFTRKAILSVHPADYLEMSNKDNSWSSCHCLEDGDWKGGTLSYMNDGVTMIFYTVDSDAAAPYYKKPKVTREVFTYKDGVLLQSRLYPGDYSNNSMELYRKVVRDAVAKCEGLNNDWEWIRDVVYDIDDYVKTGMYALQYEDYERVSCNQNISLLNGRYTKSDYVPMIIGEAAYCVDCGGKIEDHDAIHCRGCGGSGNYYNCEDCGREIDRDDTFWVGDYPYCGNCVCRCELCDDYVVNDNGIYAYNEYGSEIFICDDCTGDYNRCSKCGELHHYEHGDVVSDEFYCVNCLEEDFVQCDNCCEWLDKEDAIYTDDGVFCEECGTDLYFQCTECGEWINKKDGIEVDNKNYCEYCLSELTKAI